MVATFLNWYFIPFNWAVVQVASWDFFNKDKIRSLFFLFIFVLNVHKFFVNLYQKCLGSWGTVEITGLADWAHAHHNVRLSMFVLNPHCFLGFSPLVCVSSGFWFVVGEVTYVEHLMDAEGKSRVSERVEPPFEKFEFLFLFCQCLGFSVSWNSWGILSTLLWNSTWKVTCLFGET